MKMKRVMKKIKETEETLKVKEEDKVDDGDDDEVDQEDGIKMRVVVVGVEVEEENDCNNFYFD